MLRLFLLYFNAAGEQFRFALEPYHDDSSSFYLPDDPNEQSLSHQQQATHNHVRIDLFDHHVALSRYGEPEVPVTLLAGGRSLEIPSSTALVQRSLVLRPGDQFCTAAGRWQPSWEYAHGTLQSMRPPSPRPVIDSRLSDTTDGEIVHVPSAQGAMVDNTYLDDEDPELDTTRGVPVHEILLSPSLSVDDEGVADDQSPILRGSYPEDVMPSIESNHGSLIPELVPTSLNQSTEGLEDKGEPAHKDKAGHVKRSFSAIEADHDAFSHKRTQRKSLRAEADTEEEDTITLFVDNESASPQNKRKKAAAKSVPGAVTRRRASAIQRSEIQRSVTNTPMPTRISTRLVSTPLSTSRASAAANALDSQLQPVIVFSSGSVVQTDRKVMNSFKKLGGIVTDDINHANMLCVGNGPLKKTSKFVMAVVTGKDIVTDGWLQAAHAHQKLAIPEQFLPQDKIHEREWDFNLADAIERGKLGMPLLAGYDVHFTHQVQVDLGNLKADVKQIAMTLGANKVVYGLPTKRPVGREILVIGSPGLDMEGAQVSKLKTTMYNKDLLLLGALRGSLELDAPEFTIEVPTKEE